MSINYKTEYQRYRRYVTNLSDLYRSNKQVRAYVELAFAILASAFFTMFAVRPTVITIASLVAEIRSQEEVEQQLEKKVSDIRKAYDVYSGVKDRLIVLDKSWPETPRLIYFLRQIEGAIANSTTKLNSLTFDQVNEISGKPVVVDSNMADVGFNMNLSGSFENLSTFVENLENLSRVVIINSFTFNALEEGNLTLILSGVLTYQPRDEFMDINRNTQKSSSQGEDFAESGK